MSLKPQGDRVVIKPKAVELRTRGGVYLPEQSADERVPAGEGTIVAIGPGKVLDDGTKVPMSVRVGQKVVYSKYAGSEIKWDGEDVLILQEKDILAEVTA